jgi:hypothetical protein
MRLDRTTGQIVMEGGAEARSDVSALVKNLEDSSVFRGVMVDGQVSRDRKTGRYVFKITCSLEAGS